MKPSVIVITGPTGSGKSALSLKVAEDIGAEIINADSVSVYKDFNIGSSKPGSEELSRIKHHLVSVKDPEEEFSAGEFRRMAADCITDITSRGRSVLVVGGTGLYISALLGGLIEVGQISTDARQKLKAVEKQFLQENSVEELSSYLHQTLTNLDSVAASGIHVNDILRVRRALLINWSIGVSVSDMRKKHEYQQQDYRALVVSILPDRDALYERIDSRVDKMISEGLLGEVKQLINRYSQNAAPFRSIGYRHMLQFLNAEMDFDSAVSLMKRDTRRFAKRQFTWWRHQPDKLGWVEVNQQVSLTQSINNFLKRSETFIENEVYYSTIS